MHATEASTAANMATESATVTRCDAVATATNPMATAVLREGRRRRQRKDDRRNVKQATHAYIISPF
jgi:hypothetical protein